MFSLEEWKQKSLISQFCRGWYSVQWRDAKAAALSKQDETFDVWL